MSWQDCLVDRRWLDRHTQRVREDLLRQVEEKRARLDPARREVTVDGRPIRLRPKEVQILEILLREQGRTVSRDTLIQKVWSLDFDGDERMVDRHVAALRQKLGAAAQHIKSVYGAGYRLGGKE